MTDKQEVKSLDAVEIVRGELKVTSKQVSAVARLLLEGNTVPFIARYRKEVTGNLDEVQITAIQERLNYFKELEERKETILKSIEEQGKLTDSLKAKILKCTTKNALEDIYLPYKPKRRTRAMIAREKGLEPLAGIIMKQPANGDLIKEATAFIDKKKGVDSTEDAISGARDIIAEIVSENADVRAHVRQVFAKSGILKSEAVEKKTKEPTKFEQYYEFSQNIADIPSHRYLAIRRGEKEGVLRYTLEVNEAPILQKIEEMSNVIPSSPFAGEMKKSIEDGYKRLIAPSVEVDVVVDSKMKADRSAVEVFAQNLRNVLMSAPLGVKKVIGIDPGIRTGCKCAAVDSTGKFLDTITIYPGQGGSKDEMAMVDLLKFIIKHKPFAIAIGNGTAGRETEAFTRDALSKAKIKDVIVVSVNESGASVYSASEVAREEFPELDLTIRGAISIARRLQDPLSELVKVDPKSIGVGQYQHDVYQPLLQSKLDEVVVSCVNQVGVELNTASAPLLSRVSGINTTLAKKIISYRDENGTFKSRSQLKKVSGLGPKAFEQCAGFLRIHGSSHPLDASAVHPERYELVEKMASDIKVALPNLIGNTELVDKIDIKKYISENVGEPTLRDILAELKKPGRDPRQSFEPPKFRDDVTTMEDLKIGMELEGIVTNVTAFGAFVDIGVHQDGLVHISQLSDKFISAPSEVVQAGDKINVRVLEIDIQRKRISLSAKKEGAGQKSAGTAKNGVGKKDVGSGFRPEPRTFSNNPFADL